MTVSRKGLRTSSAVGILAVAVMALVALAMPAGAGAHAERATFFPDPDLGSFPEYRTTGSSVVVCKPQSRGLIQELPSELRRYNEALLTRCQYQSIQTAINQRGRIGQRILVLPGEYFEHRY